DPQAPASGSASPAPRDRAAAERRYQAGRTPPRQRVAGSAEEAAPRPVLPPPSRPGQVNPAAILAPPPPAERAAPASDDRPAGDAIDSESSSITPSSALDRLVDRWRGDAAEAMALHAAGDYARAARRFEGIAREVSAEAAVRDDARLRRLE